MFNGAWIECTRKGQGFAMKAVGVIGPDFMPRLFDIDEPLAAADGVVVEVMAASVNGLFVIQSALTSACSAPLCRSERHR
jgi:hypothetical protein